MNSFRSAILKGKSSDPTNPLVSEKQGRDSEGDDLTSVEIPRDSTRSANHRDGDRHRLTAESVVIVHKRKKHQVELINLSGGGAMIRGPIKARLWDKVGLVLGEGSAIECAVRWIRDDRLGLEFAHETQIECDPQQRDELLLDVIRRSFPEAVAQTTPEVDPAPATPAVPTESRRGERRHPLIWSGEMLWRHDAHTVRIRNISTTGALIDCPVDVPADSEVMLDLGEGRQFFATVGWSRGGQAGLAFKEPFDITTLAAVKPQVTSRWEKPSYLDVPAGQSSPWASQWQRSSIEEIRNELEGYMKH